MIVSEVESRLCGAFQKSSRSPTNSSPCPDILPRMKRIELLKHSGPGNIEQALPGFVELTVSWEAFYYSDRFPTFTSP